MTGWRIGWAITNPELVALCGKIQEALVSCPPAVSQAAAEAALRGPQDAVEEMRVAYQRGVTWCVRSWNRLGCCQRFRRGRSTP
jgi:aspartate/methionine/tyrosine aminotransferase